MRINATPTDLIDQLRAWFHPKDRSVVMADDCFIEGDEISTPDNPRSGRRRLYAKSGGWYDLDSFGLETRLCDHVIAKNTSGAVATANDVGYIDYAGEYKTTTTANLSADWCVVITGGANGSDIYVTRNGLVTVVLNGNCSVGNYLYTSTTATQAAPLAYIRPEVFAVARTANAGGAGGTCVARLLCNTVFVPMSYPQNIFRVDASALSDWNATIATLPGGAPTTLTYTTTSGSDTNLVPASTSQYAKLRLYNSTRATYALISNCVLGTTTITLTTNVPAGWAVGDNITIRSQVNTDVIDAVQYFLDAEITGTTINPLTRALQISMFVADTSSSNIRAVVHPWETGSASKRFAQRTQAVSIPNYVTVSLSIIQSRFCILWGAGGASSVSVSLLGMGEYRASS